VSTASPKRRLKLLKVLIACVAVLAFMTTMASAAHATEHQFCWGYNLASGNDCGTANWYMNAAYADSSQGAVCLYMSGNGSLYACEKKATEGIYLNVGCYCYGDAAIFNYTGKTIKVYGQFWTE
jgi:TRAP-type C4-dicarboxylate transport system substrate-binding protein